MVAKFLQAFLLLSIGGALLSCSSTGSSNSDGSFGPSIDQAALGPVHPRSGEFIGLGLFEAMDKAESSGLRSRILVRDGDMMQVGSENVPGRLGFTIENDVVTAAHEG